MVVKIRTRCKRCGGSGHYSYNALDGTRCYGCGGRGYVVDTVRAYTEKEKASMDRAAARQKERKAEERRQKIQRNIDNKPVLMQAFYEKNGFNEQGETFMVIGDSYSIKDELKANGFKYDSTLKWHGPAAAQYSVVKVKFSDIYDWDDERAIAEFKPSAYDKIAELAKSAEISAASGDFIGEVKERLRNLNLVLKSRYKNDGYYGISECLTFEDKNHNYFSWWTSTFPNIQIGDEVIVTGTVKDHNTYKGHNITVLTRCKIEKEG